MLGGAISVARPVRNHASISELNAAAAAACVGRVLDSSEATFSGEAGGVPVNPAAAMPVPTVVANAANAASNPEAAEGAANAEASELASVEAAALTVVEAGTIDAA